MEIRKITIAGAGTMGYSMEEIFDGKDYDVILWNGRRRRLRRTWWTIFPTPRTRCFQRAGPHCGKHCGKSGGEIGIL